MIQARHHRFQAEVFWGFFYPRHIAEVSRKKKKLRGIHSVYVSYTEQEAGDPAGKRCAAVSQLEAIQACSDFWNDSVTVFAAEDLHLLSTRRIWWGN